MTCDIISAVATENVTGMMAPQTLNGITVYRGDYEPCCIHRALLLKLEMSVRVFLLVLLHNGLPALKIMFNVIGEESAVFACYLTQDYADSICLQMGPSFEAMHE